MPENSRKLIMIMVDGFGVPPEGWENSVFAKYCSAQFIKLFKENSIGLDATLGVQGIPQSATGQTALFTGKNASQIAGMHLSGFPGPKLKSILKENNIFLELTKRGYRVMFANSYTRYPLHLVLGSRFASVTSTMLSTISSKALATEELLSGDAVLHDITRETLSYEYNLPEITPQEGANHLLKVSSDYDFVLFEHFMTDKAGHSGNMEQIKRVLEIFSEFLVELIEKLPQTTGLLVCSDHGNCEDPQSKQHTLNKVPLLLINIADPHPIPKSITDVYNLVLNYFEKGR